MAEGRRKFFLEIFCFLCVLLKETVKLGFPNPVGLVLPMNAQKTRKIVNIPF